MGEMSNERWSRGREDIAENDSLARHKPSPMLVDKVEHAFVSPR